MRRQPKYNPHWATQLTDYGVPSRNWEPLTKLYIFRNTHVRRHRYGPFRKRIFHSVMIARNSIQCPFCPRFRQTTIKTEIHRIYRHTLGLGGGVYYHAYWHYTRYIDAQNVIQDKMCFTSLGLFMMITIDTDTGDYNRH